MEDVVERLRETDRELKSAGLISVESADIHRGELSVFGASEDARDLRFSQTPGLVFEKLDGSPSF